MSIVPMLMIFTAPAQANPWWTPTPASTPAAQVVVNGSQLSDTTIAQLGAGGQPVMSGDYWYDSSSGLWGITGGPALGVLMAGLHLGGPLQPGASGGGTGVYINGREIHPQDLAALQALLGWVAPGRYFLDGWGNAGLEGGMATVNLYVAASSQQGGAAAGGTTGGGTWSWSGGSAGAIEGSAFVCSGAGDCSSWSP